VDAARRLRLRNRKRPRTTSAMSAAAPMPAPMPAFAPVLRPPDDSLVVVFVVAEFVGSAVFVADVEAVCDCVVC
jgi:hypothetical protein